jgi:predicted HicB family RNase H-like nuclease
VIDARQPRKTLKHKIDVRVDEDMMRAIRIEANRDGVSDGAIVRRALRCYFKDAA